MIFPRNAAAAALAACGLAFAAAPAHAKPARCFTTDDGHYSCDFHGVDRIGSFVIQAPGYPTYTLQIDRPGVAFGFVNVDNRNIPLPGQYLRSRDDGACWSNPEMGTKICAW